MSKQAMNKGPRIVAWRGVHYDPCRFVQYNQGIVFINQSEGYRLRFYPRGADWRDGDDNDIAWTEALASLGGKTVDLDVLTVDECLSPGSG
jgi:hypothetical protein